MAYYFDYIIDHLKSLYHIDPALVIGYGENANADICIKDQSSDFFTSENPDPGTIVWKEWDGKRLPFLFSVNDFPIHFHKTGNQTLITEDLIGNIFFFLSGWQEVHSSIRDNHGRYPFQESIQYKHAFITTPVVDYYLNILVKAIETHTASSVKRKLWPSSALCCSLSHDIDKINHGWMEDSFTALKRGKPVSAFKYLFSKFGNKDPWNNLDEIINLENASEVRSTFFFITKKGSGNADYELQEVEPYFSSIRESGSEVSLHASLNSCHNADELTKEKKTFDFDITGNRFHFLKLEPSTFPKVINDAAFIYDSSMGFAEHIGFRNGTCFPFKPFDLVQKQGTGFIEIPLIIMDATLKNPEYMGNVFEKKVIISTLFEEVEKFGGLISILWHNNYFSEMKYQGWRELYIELISDLKARGCRFLTCSEIAKEYLHE